MVFHELSVVISHASIATMRKWSMFDMYTRVGNQTMKSLCAKPQPNVSKHKSVHAVRTKTRPLWAYTRTYTHTITLQPMNNTQKQQKRRREKQGIVRGLPVYLIKMLWPQWIYGCPHPHPVRPIPQDMWCPAVVWEPAALSMLFDIAAFPPCLPNEVLWSTPVPVPVPVVGRIHHQSQSNHRRVGILGCFGFVFSMQFDCLANANRWRRHDWRKRKLNFIPRSERMRDGIQESVN